MGLVTKSIRLISARMPLNAYPIVYFKSLALAEERTGHT